MQDGVQRGGGRLQDKLEGCKDTVRTKNSTFAFYHVTALRDASFDASRDFLVLPRPLISVQAVLERLQKGSENEQKWPLSSEFCRSSVNRRY